MDWTAMGAPPPILIFPTQIWRVSLRCMINDMGYIMRGFEMRFCANLSAVTGLELLSLKYLTKAL
jgi:hypothetical protein